MRKHSPNIVGREEVALNSATNMPAIFLAIMKVVLLLTIALVGVALGDFVVPPAQLAEAPYAEWAHYHWVWLGSSQANQTSESELVQGYLDRDVPVGAVNIDSNWATGDNTFVWNAKWPNASEFIATMHSQNIKVIAWATSMVDTDSPNYDEGKSAGYYLNDGKTIKWWHGHGSLLDYTNPEAVSWWHKQMDVPLDMGLDGFKVDGTDPYIFELVIAKGKGGIVTYREYADAYYGDFFDYSRLKRGPEALIMSRPVDTFFSFSPRRVVFSGWVGDQNPTFEGLKTALTDYMHSAWRGYVGFGSDIGGYRCCGPEPFGRSLELFTRWFQVGAFSPLMENGGDNEHRPWMFDRTNATLDNYRKFATIHTELAPYLLATGTTAFAEEKGSIIRPMAVDLGPISISNFDYKLGNDIFVAPMTEENSTSRTVKFPKGEDWVDWWDSSKVYKGDSEVNYDCPLTVFPVFHRKGSALPLRVSSHYGGHGTRASAGHLTILISHPTATGSATVNELGGGGRTVTYTYNAASGDLKLVASAHKENLIIMLRGVSSPMEVEEAGRGEMLLQQHTPSADSGYYVDSVTGDVFIRPGDASRGNIVVVRGMFPSF